MYDNSIKVIVVLLVIFVSFMALSCLQEALNLYSSPPEIRVQVCNTLLQAYSDYSRTLPARERSRRDERREEMRDEGQTEREKELISPVSPASPDSSVSSLSPSNSASSSASSTDEQIMHISHNDIVKITFSWKALRRGQLSLTCEKVTDWQLRMMQEKERERELELERTLEKDRDVQAAGPLSRNSLGGATKALRGRMRSGSGGNSRYGHVRHNSLNLSTTSATASPTSFLSHSTERDAMSRERESAGSVTYCFSAERGINTEIICSLKILARFIPEKKEVVRPNILTAAWHLSREARDGGRLSSGQQFTFCRENLGMRSAEAAYIVLELMETGLYDQLEELAKHLSDDAEKESRMHHALEVLYRSETGLGLYDREAELVSFPPDRDHNKDRAPSSSILYSSPSAAASAATVAVPISSITSPSSGIPLSPYVIPYDPFYAEIYQIWMVKPTVTFIYAKRQGAEKATLADRSIYRSRSVRQGVDENDLILFQRIYLDRIQEISLSVLCGEVLSTSLRCIAVIISDVETEVKAEAGRNEIKLVAETRLRSRDAPKPSIGIDE